MFAAFTLMLAFVSSAFAGDDEFYKKAVLEQICYIGHAAKVSDNKAVQASFCACFVEEMSFITSAELFDTPEGQAMFSEADRVCRAKPVTLSAEAPRAPVTEEEKRLSRNKALIWSSCVNTQAARPDVGRFCTCRTDLVIPRMTPSQSVSALDPALIAEVDAVCAQPAAPPAAAAPQEP